MKFRLISPLLLLVTCLYGQFALKTDIDPCSRQYIYEPAFSKHERLVFEGRYDDFLKHHLDTSAQKLHQFVTADKDKLVEFEAVSCFDHYVHFNAPSPDGKRLLVTILLKDTLQVKTPADTFSKYNFTYDIAMNSGRILHGHLPKSDTMWYRKIDRIELSHDGRRFEAPKALYEDLVNPNTCNADRSIRPIELLWDPEHEIFYLYIFGKVNEAFDPNQTGHYRMASSFATKLIFSHEEVIGRILLDGYFLEKYGWADCISFWPF